MVRLHPLRVAAWLAAGPALGAALLACTHSGLGQPTGDTAGTLPTTADCPWVGEWKLLTISCSAFAVDGWEDDFGKATMVITQEEGGGCRANADITATGVCNQEERWHISAPIGSAVSIEMDGVIGCQPAACVFPGDATCVRDSGARSIPDGYLADVGGNLEARDLLADTVPTCGLDVITTWGPK